MNNVEWLARFVAKAKELGVWDTNVDMDLLAGGFEDDPEGAAEEVAASEQDHVCLERLWCRLECGHKGPCSVHAATDH